MKPEADSRLDVSAAATRGGPTRRMFVTRTLAAASSAWVRPAWAAQDDIAPAERAAMAELAAGFMQSYSVPGLSVAIGRGGGLVYQEAFGSADRDRGEPLTPRHRFRIASVTKPITLVAIFSLIEQGRLRLEDRVFGTGVLATDFGTPGRGAEEITIAHLLTHTGGGWSNAHDDPMFMDPRMAQAELIAWTLRNRPLDNPPGTAFAYSNFGYCVLGRVIEKVARAPYAAFVADAVLRRCGVTDMTIAGNTSAQRQSGEVGYLGQGGEDPYRVNVTRMDSHGGWIARPSDLVQFAMAASGFTPPANILGPATLREMTTASAANARYAKGWAVNSAGNWWHNGSLPGTETIMVRTHSGFCWAAFINTRRPHSSIGGDLDALVWKMARQVSAWRV
jgi:CubicO group peptidase (beta-lactamase class C family)